VELAQGLGELAWRLEEGRQGFGRAGLGLVLAPGEAASWVGAFPHNAFRVPVTLDPTGDGARLAAGLLQSQLRQAIEGFVLLRRARLELDKPMDAVRLWSGLASLTWGDLTPTERERCPYMLLVGSSRIVAGSGLSQVTSLLTGDLPLKVLVLADLDQGLSTRTGPQSVPASGADATIDLSLLALAQRDAFIAQASVGAPTHFLRSIEAGLDYDGPALFHIHAPSPGRHGFATGGTLEQARLAVTTRTFPLFSYDPRGAGVFGTRIDLEANPDPLAVWTGQTGDGSATPADWALGEARFQEWFEPLADDAPDPVPLGAYLDLAEGERSGRTAFVSRKRPRQDPLRYEVADALIEATRKRRDAWRLLQEIGGLVTPFTDRVRRESEQRVASEHQAELAAQAADYEARLAALRDELLEELRDRIRERLMTMAGYRRVGGKGIGERTEGSPSRSAYLDPQAPKRVCR
jgi:pyruvate-ferredoxin/flavodoxin oxidoreductase